MNNTDIVQSIFAAVDQRDAESFAAFFTDDGCSGLQIKILL